MLLHFTIGRCAALAESKLGAGRESKVFVMLTLGTGIGGALVIDGNLFDGVSFDSGDFGHHVIRSGHDAMPCVCGKSGCFEVHASAAGLTRHYHRLANAQCSFQQESVQATSKMVLNAEDVIVAMRAGNSMAMDAFTQYMDDLSTGLANIVTFYNPDIICLGGGLSQAPELFVGLQERIDEKTLPATRGKVRIVPSQLGTDSGAIGAALLCAMRA